MGWHNYKLIENKMKTKILLWNLLALLFLVSCDKNEIDDVRVADETETGNPVAGLPDGFFEVNFTTSPSFDRTKAVTGPDGRVRHIRYIIYNDSTKQFVKEKAILTPLDPVPSWPFQVIRDTLPKGKYRAVFLGNVEKTQFPYATPSSAQNYQEVLVNYQGKYDDARINLPPVEFSFNTEYYWANITFSDKSVDANGDGAADANVLLQRIIGGADLSRNVIDAQPALNKLAENIRTQVKAKDIIRKSVTDQLPTLLGPTLKGILGPVLGLTFLLTHTLDEAVNPIIDALVAPITDALYDLLLTRLVNELGLVLNGNSGQTGALGPLDNLLNPWQSASSSIVTIDKFPKTIDFGLKVTDFYPDGQRFRYKITNNTTAKQSYISVIGFNEAYNIKKINVLSQGLVSGLVVDQTLDGLLLSGSFVDVNDSITIATALDKRNLKYKADYSLLDIGLKSYDVVKDGNQPLKVKIRLGDIANLNDALLKGVNDLISAIPLVGTILGALTGGLTVVVNNLVASLFGGIKDLSIEVAVPINVSLLGIDQLTLSGSWSAVTPK